jgi:hypothetical protein
MGAIAALLGAALAAATALGVVHTASSGTFEPQDSVLQYGTTNQ